MINIAILGYGTVGSGVYDIACENADSIQKRTGKKICVKKILDLRDFDDHPHKELFTKNYDEILSDKEIDIVVETIGGLEPAYRFTKSALLAGKSVVTSNKELVATHGTELLALAKEKNVNYMFEASVGGGIPVIRPLNSCLLANNVAEIFGILNGTTNYILTKMIKDGISFDTALLQAQENGYAERNPAADIEGHDACRKICILASLAFGKGVKSENVYTEGITNITLEDVRMAEGLGYVIKLIGYTKNLGDKVICRVSPMLIDKSNPLASVEDVFNAIMVRADMVGDVMFYGRGAGKLPTASAVMADVIDIAKNPDNKNYTWEVSGDDYVDNYEKAVVGMFVRAKNTSAEKIKDIFDADAIDGENGELYFAAKAESESEINAKLAHLDADIVSKIRIME